MQDLGEQQVQLGVWHSEPLARLAAARLEGACIPCVVQSVGVGHGGQGMAVNLPHALYVRPTDHGVASSVLELTGSALAPGLHHASFLAVRAVLLVIALAVIMGLVDAVFGRVFQ